MSKTHIGISDELLDKMTKDPKLYRGEYFRLVNLSDWINYTCLSVLKNHGDTFIEVYNNIKKNDRIYAQDAQILNDIGINIYAGLAFYIRDKEHEIFSYDEICEIMHLMYISFEDFYNTVKILIDKKKPFDLDIRNILNR